MMFAIYGTSGLIYRGPIEDLRKVAPTLRTSRVRALQAETDRDITAVPGLSPPVPGHPGPGSPAVRAYEGVQHPALLRRPLSRVDDVWSSPSVEIPLGSTVESAWRVLNEHGVGQAPVVDEGQRLVGLLMRAELMARERLPSPDAPALLWRAWLGQPVADAMLSPVPSVTPDTDLRRLALLLLETGLPGVPVVPADGRVTGFVSRSDILKAVVHDPPLDLWAG